MKTIGFFGDSYCAIAKIPEVYKEYTDLKTYVTLVSEKYKLRIVNLGQPGSSIYDSLLLQFDPFLKRKQFPDVCVFVWTDPHRIFHRTNRKINFGTAHDPSNTSADWEAARSYYKELYYPELEHLRYVSALYYYDHVIFPKIPNNVKLIHLWSFGEYPDTAPTKKVNPNDIRYAYRWNTGVEIRPSLVTMSRCILDKSPNHIGVQEKNDILSDRISMAIDNYANGKLLEF